MRSDPLLEAEQVIETVGLDLAENRPMQSTRKTHSIWHHQNILEMPQSLNSDLRLLIIGSLIDLFSRLPQTEQNLFDLRAKVLAVSYGRMLVELLK